MEKIIDKIEKGVYYNTNRNTIQICMVNKREMIVL